MPQKLWLHFVCLLTMTLLPCFYCACPSVCVCNPDNEAVNCNSQSLTELPNDIPNSTKILYIEGNSIASISSNAFAFYDQLEDLDLSNNQLTSLPDGLFANNPSLRRVILVKNQITSLPEELFASNPALNVVSLSENLITTINVNVFPSVTGMTSLNLQRNPLLCCTMSGFIEWYQNQTNLRSISVTCIDFGDTDEIVLESFDNTGCIQDWIPLVIGLVVGFCVIFVIIVVIAVVCLKKSRGKKILSTDERGISDDKEIAAEKQQ